MRQVTALRAEVERLSKDYETTRAERDKVCASCCFIKLHCNRTCTLNAIMGTIGSYQKENRPKMGCNGSLTEAHGAVNSLMAKMCSSGIRGESISADAHICGGGDGNAGLRGSRQHAR